MKDSKQNFFNQLPSQIRNYKNYLKCVCKHFSIKVVSFRNKYPKSKVDIKLNVIDP